jgi:uncharacterized iron-regulated protein
MGAWILMKVIKIIIGFMLPAVLCLTGCQNRENIMPRCGFWIDAYAGEPVAYEQVLEDLAEVDVVYLGERHTLQRHHDIQYQLVSDLIASGHTVVLGLEQLEAFQQPALDLYNQKKITYEELAKQIDWGSRWSNYLDYRRTVEAVHRAGGTIAALNARQEIVRQVARKGLDALSAEERRQLPQEIDLGDAAYREHLNQTMQVMAHVQDVPEMLDRMFTAQVCRDEMMADRLAETMNRSAEHCVIVVLCGSGHVRHGSGIPNRLRRRMPQVEDRIVVLSGSGDVVLSGSMRAMSRDVTIRHGQLRCFKTPVADYLHVVNLNGQVYSYTNDNP